MDPRLEILRRLIEDPSSNPNAAALAIVILVLGFLLIAVSVLAWAMPHRKKPSGADEELPAPEPGRLARLFPPGFAVALIALAAIVAAYASTSASTFCGSVCHDMLRPSDTWKASSHADVPCVSCHEGSPAYAPAALVTRTRCLFEQVTHDSALGASVVPSERCLGCHAQIRRGILIGSSGVAMRHSDVIAAGAACDDCHGGQGHEQPGVVVAMSKCLPCHDGKTAQARCATCHRTSADQLIRPVDSSFGKVALQAPPACGGCHDQKPCDRCHGVRMPHPADYADPRLHAKAAAFSGKDTTCYRCHIFADCSPCHKSFDAHVKDWLHVHRTYPRDTQWCAGCHRTKDMCSLCHGPEVGKRSATTTRPPSAAPATAPVQPSLPTSPATAAL